MQRFWILLVTLGLFACGGSGTNTTPPNGHVLTLATDLVIAGDGVVDLAPVDVRAFRAISFFVWASRGDALFKIAFTTEPGAYANPVPKGEATWCTMPWSGVGGLHCHLRPTVPVWGPFVAIRIEGGGKGLPPVTMTLTAYVQP